MLERDVQEWEEYDARLLEETQPAVSSFEASRSAVRFRPASAGSIGDLDSPFLFGRETEAGIERIEGERYRARTSHRSPSFRSGGGARPGGCNCDCGASATDSVSTDAGPFDDGSNESGAWVSDPIAHEQKETYSSPARLEIGELETPSNLCPPDDPLIIRGFGQYRAEIPPDQLAKLDAIASTIEKLLAPLPPHTPGAAMNFKPNITVVVLGHVDTDAARESREPGFLQNLSEQRAIAVYDYLWCKLGEAKAVYAKWEVAGRAGRSPAVPKPRTNAEHQCNRRVDIILKPRKPLPQLDQQQNSHADTLIEVFWDYYHVALQGTSGQFENTSIAVQKAREIAEKAEDLISRRTFERRTQCKVDINKQFMDFFKDALQGAASKFSDPDVVVSKSLELAVHSASVVLYQAKERRQWREASLPQPMDGDCEPGGRAPGGPPNHVLCRIHDHILDTTSGTVIAHDLDEYNKTHPVNGASRKTAHELETEMKTQGAAYEFPESEEYPEPLMEELVPTVSQTDLRARIDEYFNLANVEYTLPDGSKVKARPQFQMANAHSEQNAETLESLFERHFGAKFSKPLHTVIRCAAYGRARPDEIAALTQHLIDAGELDAVRDANSGFSNQQLVRALQRKFNIGIDCGGYVQLAFIFAFTGKHDDASCNVRSLKLREDLGLKSLRSDENLADLPAPHFTEVGFLNGQTGDLLVLGWRKGERDWHTVIVVDHSVSGDIHTFLVDASWGFLYEADAAGVARRKLMFDKSTGTWWDVDPRDGTKANPNSIGPYMGHPIKGMYRAKTESQTSVVAPETLEESEDQIAIDYSEDAVDPFPSQPYVLGREMTNQEFINCASVVESDPDTSEMCGAVADLTGDPELPVFYAHNPLDMLYVASLVKIYPFYVAFELRRRVQQQTREMIKLGLSTATAGWERQVFAALEKAWKPKLKAAFPAFPEGMPKFADIFVLSPTGEVKFAQSDPPLTNADLDFRPPNSKPGRPPISPEYKTPPGKFLDWMRLMLRWSNNEAASKCIRALSYPYINGVLGGAGFFDSKTRAGLWLSGDYLGNDWLKADGAAQPLSPRWARLQARRVTNFGGNALQVARMMMFIARSPEMISLMTGVDGIGSYIREGLAGASPARAFTAIASKIGCGDEVPAPACGFSHDCAIVRIDRGGDPAKTIRYMVVALGEPPGRARADLHKMVVRFHDCVVARHPVS